MPSSDSHVFLAVFNLLVRLSSGTSCAGEGSVMIEGNGEDVSNVIVWSLINDKKFKIKLNHNMIESITMKGIVKYTKKVCNITFHQEPRQKHRILHQDRLFHNNFLIWF